MLKPSKFNFIYKKDDDYIVYNTFSKAVAILDENDMKYISSDSISDNSDITLELKENGFLVDIEFDENAFLKYYNQKIRFSSEYFSLTIAPSLSCNFDCPYCFENKRTGVMSEEIQEALIKYVIEKIRNGVKIIEITWYGGEPLMQFQIIKALCEKFTDICKKNNVLLKMGMISNGYLLSEEIVDFLEKYEISFQVTLDGLRKNHNQRRYLKGGKETFDTIFSNLKLFNNKKVDIYVRMNVDNYNYTDYSQLDRLIADINNDRMILYPALTENINERKKERKNNYMSSSVYDDFISLTRKNGLFKFKESSIPISNDVGSIPNDRCYFCAAELINSIVVDDRGNVYKCWNEEGYDDYCFNLMQPYDINYNSLLRYMGDNVFEDEKCKECVFLSHMFWRM